jgi:hypothetical protein
MKWGGVEVGRACAGGGGVGVKWGGVGLRLGVQVLEEVVWT